MTVVEILQGSVVTQTMLDGLAICLGYNKNAANNSAV